MSKMKMFWYISEAILLAIYIAMFAIVSSNIWLGILSGVIIIIARNLVAKNIKVDK